MIVYRHKQIRVEELNSIAYHRSSASHGDL
jgi:hypothetical protein